MPVAVSYPGVYIEEIPSGVHTITGVATSIAAFVDFFPQGPLDEATQVFSFADFERQFGGLDGRSEASYAVQQFFLNGGSQAYVVRTTSSQKSAAAAAIGLSDKVGGTAVLTATAASPGQWGNSLRIDVDYGTTDPDNFFNLTVMEVAVSNGTTQIVATEKFRNLVIDSSKSNDAAAASTALFVQAGAFSDPANAERLAEQLRGRSYGKVFVREDQIAGRRMYRVRIGPVPDVAEFDRIVAALERAGINDARLALD